MRRLLLFHEGLTVFVVHPPPRPPPTARSHYGELSRWKGVIFSPSALRRSSVLSEVSFSPVARVRPFDEAVCCPRGCVWRWVAVQSKTPHCPCVRRSFGNVPRPSSETPKVLHACSRGHPRGFCNTPMGTFSFRSYIFLLHIRKA